MHAVEGPQQGGLAGPGRPDESGDLALVDVEGHVAHRGAAGKGDGHVAAGVMTGLPTGLSINDLCGVHVQILRALRESGCGDRSSFLPLQKMGEEAAPDAQDQDHDHQQQRRAPGDLDQVGVGLAAVVVDEGRRAAMGLAGFHWRYWLPKMVSRSGRRLAQAAGDGQQDAR